MSEVAQELAKHINKLKHLATNLSTEVADLETDIPTDAMGGEGWTLGQRDELWATIADHAETCERAIRTAVDNVDDFRRSLLDTFRPQGGW